MGDGSIRDWIARSGPHVLRGTEIIALGLVAAAAAVLGWNHGGQIDGTDVLLYLDAAQRGSADVFILNRYVHVYLHTLFNALAPTPLAGARLFSAYLAAACVVLVYLCARALTPRSTPLNGVIAVGAILSLPLTLGLLAAPQVDSTLMIVMLLTTLLFIISARHGHERAGWIVGLGAALFLGMKTKETALAALVILPGLGMDLGGHFEIRRLMRNTGRLGFGLVAAGTGLMLVNTVVIGDPLFGFRPAEFVALARIAEDAFVLRPAGGDWLSGAVLASGTTVFILYILAGMRRKASYLGGVRLVWLIPLALLCILTFTLIRSTWGPGGRYIAPGLALMCVLAGNVVDGRLGTRMLRGLHWSGPLIAAAIVGGTVLIGLSLRGQWPFPEFYASIVWPIVFAALLGAFFALDPSSRTVQLAVGTCALILTIYPARVTVLKLVRTSPLERTNTRFDPLQSFETRFDRGDVGRLFTTPRVAERLRIGPNRNELAMVVNVVLDSGASPESLTVGDPDAKLRAAMAAEQYDFVLLTRDDWDTVRVADEDTPGWRDGYTLTEEPTGRYFLLELRQWPRVQPAGPR